MQSESSMSSRKGRECGYSRYGLTVVVIEDTSIDDEGVHWLVAVGFHFQSERSHAPKMKDVHVLVKI